MSQFTNPRHSTGRMDLAAECASRGGIEERLLAQVSFAFTEETDYGRRIHEAALAGSYNKDLTGYGSSVQLR